MLKDKKNFKKNNFTLNKVGKVKFQLYFTLLFFKLYFISKVKLTAIFSNFCLQINLFLIILFFYCNKFKYKYVHL